MPYKDKKLALEKQRLRHRERVATDPEYVERKRRQRRAAQANYVRRKQDDPEFAAKELDYDRARQKRRAADPVYQATERVRALKRSRQRAERMNADPVYGASQRAYFAAHGRKFRRKSSAARSCQVTGNRSAFPLPGYIAGTGLVDRCHIKSRAYCSKEEARDPNNILLLDVRLHRLFDSGLALVAPNGSLMLHKELPDEIRAEWQGKSVSGYTLANDLYMSFARKRAYYAGFEEAA